MMIEAYSWRVSNKQQVCNWVAPVTSASWTSSMDLATMKKQVAWSSTQVLLILDCWKIISFGLPTIWDNPYLAKIQMKLDHVGPIKMTWKRWHRMRSRSAYHSWFRWMNCGRPVRSEASAFLNACFCFHKFSFLTAWSARHLTMLL